MKLVFHVILVFLTLHCWGGFNKQGRELHKLETQIEEAENLDDDGKTVEELKDKKVGVEGSRMVYGLLLTLFSCAVAGIFVSVYLLPFIARQASDAILGSGARVDRDEMREAHAALAQGDYKGAIDAYRRFAKLKPDNRLPWVEMAKIYRVNLNAPEGAIAVLHEGFKSHPWQADDAAYLMFRVAEIHDQDLGQREVARSIMQQVIDGFPDTRHAANASHKLKEWEFADQRAAGIDPRA